MLLPSSEKEMLGIEQQLIQSIRWLVANHASSECGLSIP
jgi:hypothetical protein